MCFGDPIRLQCWGFLYLLHGVPHQGCKEIEAAFTALEMEFFLRTK